jgi:hypothetical protein
MTLAEGAATPVRLTPDEILDDATIDVVIDSLLRTDPPPFGHARARHRSTAVLRRYVRRAALFEDAPLTTILG